MTKSYNAVEHVAVSSRLRLLVNSQLTVEIE